MNSYLTFSFDDSEAFINTYDELPFWSAPFGLLLFKYLELKPNLTVIDIGSGSGFPLMELAGRLGQSCKLFGIDTWINANMRAQQKIKNYKLPNVEILTCSAEQIPFNSNTIDLIVSNLGMNNFSHPSLVFKECYRVLKPNGKLALTTNLNGHWKEFYKIFAATLKQLDKLHLIDVLANEQQHRGTIETISKLFTESGFKICRHFEENFEMNFVDGSAFLNHYFIKLGWVTNWKLIFPKEELKEIFTTLEQNLNSFSIKNNGLNFSVPMVFIEGIKI